VSGKGKREIPLALLRHGPTEWTEDKRLQGHTDVPLSDAGRKAVAAWCFPAQIRNYELVSSPMKRAMETAQIIAGSVPVVEPRLKEMHWGEWEGCRLSELRASLGQDMADNEARGLDFRPAGGESPREVLARVRPWLLEVAASARPVIAVTHKSVIRALIAQATGWGMTGRAPAKVHWGALQLLRINSSGDLAVEGLDVIAGADD